MDVVLMYGFCFGSILLAGAAGFPIVGKRIRGYLQIKSTEATEQLEEMFVSLSRESVWLAYAFSPLAFGLLGWMLSGKWIGGAAGVVVGVLVPGIVVKQMDRRRRSKFQSQLIDGLLVLSSSLKAGLSMLQAFTVLAEEMPTPISQEFSLLLKETRMGINMGEAMEHLKTRMPSDDLNLFVTSVLVARESGGDVTHIFGRLVETLRERRKIKERIKTLTFMARLQGIIMAILPFIFTYIVYKMDASYLQFFLHDPMGRVLLAFIVAMQLVGGVLFMRFSRSPL